MELSGGGRGGGDACACARRVTAACTSRGCRRRCSRRVCSRPTTKARTGSRDPVARIRAGTKWAHPQRRRQDRRAASFRSARTVASRVKMSFRSRARAAAATRDEQSRAPRARGRDRNGAANSKESTREAPPRTRAYTAAHVYAQSERTEQRGPEERQLAPRCICPIVCLLSPPLFVCLFGADDGPRGVPRRFEAPQRRRRGAQPRPTVRGSKPIGAQPAACARGVRACERVSV
jgi:hypothetical protein